ncbi:DUF305 domain-containing protein [Tabrizicola sp.]|uniref:CopM family metallochaperone n=1 Tax=Tabrizicola sp. TaxID=2005166 RepID=UPI001A4ABCD3|nr:DUF305 domain-containing protein [Tabrizicola sp.]MBL9074831.1 DUF305 domain-containing protein [Tabrizicola sp.]
MLKHLTLAVTLVSALPAFSQEATDHSGHMMGDMGPASMAFMEANDRMHENMMMEYTGDADVDFIRGMIPHHQGAVEMAKIVLEHGKDPEVRKLAEAVIAAQEAEIKWMQDWLAKNGG